MRNNQKNYSATHSFADFFFITVSVLGFKGHNKKTKLHTGFALLWMEAARCSLWERASHGQSSDEHPQILRTDKWERVQNRQKMNRAYKYREINTSDSG